MGKVLGSVAKIALPVVGNMIAPGIGGVIGGALGGGIGGGGINSILSGGVTGGLGGAFGGGALGSLGGLAQNAGLGTVGSLLTTNGAAGTGLAGILGRMSSAMGPGLLGSTSLGGLSGLAGLANVGSGLMGMYSANKQADMLNSSNNQAMALQKKLYSQASNNFSPYIASGQNANNTLSNLLGTSGNSGTAGYGSLTSPFSMSQFQTDPGYEFRKQQGEQALNRTIGAQGNLFSGAALKEAQNFGQGLADQSYQDAYNRYMQQNQSTYDKLSGQSGAGQNAAGTLGGLGAGYGSAMSGLYGNQGNINAGANQQGMNSINESLANILGNKVGGYNGAQTAGMYKKDANGNFVPA